MKIVYGAILSFLIDLLLGDPVWMPHPVVFMGKCITIKKGTILSKLIE